MSDEVFVWVVTCFPQGEATRPSLPIGAVSTEEGAKEKATAFYQAAFDEFDDLSEFEAWCELYKVDDNTRLIHQAYRGTPDPDETSDELAWEEY